jgi:transcriptional regulator with XRE-family HTH domain
MNKALRLKIVERFGSQSDFCSATGENESLVSRVIRGREKISDQKKEKWALALGCEPVEIFSDGTAHR